jgi:hypothetical protein
MDLSHYGNNRDDVYEEDGGRIFQPVSNEVSDDWRKFQNAELHNFYLSQIIIKMIIQEDEMSRDSNKCTKE